MIGRTFVHSVEVFCVVLQAEDDVKAQVHKLPTSLRKGVVIR